MPFNGAGVYSPPASDFPAVAQTLIESTKFNNIVNDLATGLSSALLKDGQQVATARIPFALGISVDDIDEKTANTGVNVDGLLIKDGALADANGNEALKIGSATSAVNELTATNAATGNRPRLSATGDDTNVGLSLRVKGTGATAVIVLEDGNGNEILIAGPAVASAVNQITAANAATGAAPSLAASGDDANISLKLSPKGTGNVQLTDGTDLTKIAAFALSAITTGTIRTITMPDGNVDLQYSRAASDTVAGGLEIATQAEMEAAASAILAVTPGRLHFHPAPAKAWCMADANGNVAVSYNTTSVTDDGTGIITWTIGTDFSSASWAALVSVANTGDQTARIPFLVSQAAGSAQFRSKTTGAADSDPSSWYFAGFGDHT